MAHLLAAQKALYVTARFMHVQLAQSARKESPPTGGLFSFSNRFPAARG